ncbi:MULTISPECIES: hypothetical protein [unclassified Methylosinus]|uniref:hypothetical protein n=1 Tax=unclassified Methylosinus TaxID=2624500 RepID=UPI00140B397D|nr:MULTISPECIES: hypothetical protein [unclassified Methylosinus]MBU3890842.1 hypothetical protein [Methylosinus sp. KRF6]
MFDNMAGWLHAVAVKYGLSFLRRLWPAKRPGYHEKFWSLKVREFEVTYYRRDDDRQP